MSNDTITEWLLSLSMEELIELEQYLEAEIRALAQEEADELRRREKVRLENERLEQERLEKLAQEKATAASRPKSLPRNLYASLDQLAASQGLDISGLMNEIAKKSAQNPKPAANSNTKFKPKSGSGSGRR